LTSLEADRDANVHIEAFVRDVHKHIFSAHIHSWGATKLYREGCTWLAVPSGHPHFQVGSFGTWEDPAWNAENHVTHREIVFPHPYETPPKVIIWLNHLQFSFEYNERIMVLATDVTRGGFTAHINP